MSDLAKLFERVSAALRAGKPVLVADSKDRENEVDAIVSAQTVTSEWMGWMVRYTSGYICAPMPAERADLLGLPIQWPANQDQLRTSTRFPVMLPGESPPEFQLQIAVPLCGL